MIRVRYLLEASMSRRLLTVFFIILPVLALNRAAYGQTDAQDELGIKPYGAYDVTDIDAINLDNLSLTLDIPIYSLPQRGKLAVSYSVRYSNAGFGTQTTCPGPTKSSCIYTTMAAPVLGNTPTQSRFANVFMDQLIFPYFINNPTGQTYVQEGNSLPYYEMDYAIADASGASHTIAYENGVYRAVDGSGWSFIPQFTTPSPTTPVATEWTAGTAYGTAVDAQGIQYRQIQEAGGSGDFQTSIVDPDGNQIAYAGGITEFQVGAVVDTLGRTIPTVELKKPGKVQA
jgi:hypothetical protein